jgi:hypothetical protein
VSLLVELGACTDRPVVEDATAQEGGGEGVVSLLSAVPVVDVVDCLDSVARNARLNHVGDLDADGRIKIQRN